MSYKTSLGSEQDLDHILFLYGKMLNERLKVGPVNKEPGFVSISMLEGGMASKAYEGRVRDFLVYEMEGSTKDEIQRISEIMNASLVEHPTADWTIEAEPINGIRIRIAYWNSEDSMPGSASILYGAEIPKINLPVEDTKALTEILVNRFVMCYRKKTNKSPRRWVSLYR
jgi:hypothetical protein